ncbi:leucine-rich repeat domain-containing protein [Chryseobacterium gallinarum]|uniref:Leucine-rich repeat domain-containing protein n=1 Tax=Chryseobacterium gallinarum TaxID=1324352 RepID=A0ABX6KR34_CHRGL|nr:leucine-rich repeat domain-containing protein [Chryseobacterium gallinarum]QIY91080.1 hypothetical protein FOB44_10645 [Chryseobacterium gallinarum]
MKLFQYLFFLLPLLASCQQYNTQPYDKYEETLRTFPTSTTEIIIDSVWRKRDSLTYLRFDKVRNIYLSEVDSIPLWIFNFKQLKSIESFSENKKITNIPEKIGNNINLTHIELPNNNISKIPEAIYTLKNLERLNLSNNKLIYIDPKIGNLKKMKIFLLSNNYDLKDLPKEICSLSNLVSLPINNTDISKLPECVKNMENIENINISNTNINYFPIKILDIAKLKEINAKGLKLKNYKEVKAICEKKNITFYYDE